MYKIALLFLFSLSFCFGQGSSHLSKQNSYQLDLGLNQLKEENLHRKVHSGLIYGVRYSRLRTNFHQRQFQFGVHFSRPKTNYESLNASMNLQLSAGYSYLFYKVSRSKFTLLLGPELGLHYNLSHYPNWDESHLYWSNYLGLGVRSKLKFQLKEKQELMLDVFMPVTSLISRPELDRMYKIDDISLGGITNSMHSNLQGAFWNRSFAIKSRLEFRLAINERMTQAICYSFDYSRMQANEGFSFQNIQHSLGLKLYY